MRVRYTIVAERTIDIKDWGAKDNLECLNKMKDSLIQDISYVMDDLMQNTEDTLTVEELCAPQ